MSPLVIVIIVVVFGACAYFSIYMSKKSKGIMEKYNQPEYYKNAPTYLDEFMNDRFDLIKKQMQGAPIDAFTQCAYITTLSNKAKSVAATAAKTVAWAAVGVKARYNEADHAAFLVLSGEELHYIFFEEGEAKQHLIFDRLRLLNAKKGELSSTEKVTRVSSLMGRTNHKLIIDIDGESIDLIYYDKVERYPDSTLVMEKSAFDTMGKFKLMGTYFKDQFYKKYSHLSN